MSVIIRLQNLPWSANALDIRQYFRGLGIPEGGVHIVGGELGDAFIAFSTDEDARQAMMLDGGKVKEVKIKLYLSSRAEMQKVIEQARQQTVNLQSFMQLPAAPLPTVIPTMPSLASMMTQSVPSTIQMPVVHPTTVTSQPIIPTLPVVSEASISPVTQDKEQKDTDSINSNGKDRKVDRKERSRSREREPDRRKDRTRDRSRGRDRDRDRTRERSRWRRDRSSSREYDRSSRRRDRYRSSSRERSHSRDHSNRDTKRNSRDRRRDSSSLTKEDNTKDQNSDSNMQQKETKPSSVNTPSLSDVYNIAPQQPLKSSSKWNTSGFQPAAVQQFGQTSLPEFTHAPPPEFGKKLLPDLKVVQSSMGTISNFPSDVSKHLNVPEDSLKTPYPRNDMFINQNLGSFPSGQDQKVTQPNVPQVQSREPVNSSLQSKESLFPSMNRLLPPGSNAPSFTGQQNLFPGQSANSLYLNQTQGGFIPGQEGFYIGQEGFRTSQENLYLRQDNFRLEQDDNNFPVGQNRGSLQGQQGRNQNWLPTRNISENNKFGTNENNAYPYKMVDREDTEKISRFDRPPPRGGLRGRGTSEYGRGGFSSNDRYRSSPVQTTNDQVMEEKDHTNFRRNMPSFGKNIDDPRKRSERNEINNFRKNDQFERSKDMQIHPTGLGNIPPERFMKDRPFGQQKSFIPNLCVEIQNMSTDTGYADIEDFFKGLTISNNGIKMVYDNHGKRVGIAYVRFANPESKGRALGYSGRTIHGSPVEILHLSDEIFEKAIDSHSSNFESDEETEDFDILESSGCLMVQDLPFHTKEEDIHKLFTGLPIKNVALVLPEKSSNKIFTAYVQFVSNEDSRKVLYSNVKHSIGQKTVSIYPCSKKQLERACKLKSINAESEKSSLSKTLENVPSHVLPQSSPKPLLSIPIPEIPMELSRSESAKQPPIMSDCILLKQLPINTTDRNIVDFFSDVGLIPLRIHIMLDKSGSPTGDAFCEFASVEEAQRAASKDNCPLGKAEVSVKLIPRMEMTEALGIPLLPQEPTQMLGVGPKPLFPMAGRSHSGLLGSSPNSPGPRSGLLGQHPSSLPPMNMRDSPSRTPLHDGPMSRGLGSHEGSLMSMHEDSRVSLNDGPSRGLMRDGPVRGNMRDGPPRGNMHDGPPRGNMHDGPRGIMHDGPSRGNMHNNPSRGFMHDGPPRGSRNDGPPRGSRNDGPPRGSRNDGPPRGSRSDGPSRGSSHDARSRTSEPMQDIPVEGFGNPGCVLALENVPYRAEIDEILEFFFDYNVSRENVIRRFDDKGFPTGDCRVAMSSPSEAKRAVRELNMRKIRARPIYMHIL